jgi:hypothetical protein
MAEIRYQISERDQISETGFAFCDAARSSEIPLGRSLSGEGCVD